MTADSRPLGSFLADVPASFAGIPVRDVHVDSRRVEPRDLFVAVRGEHADGHRFLGAAAKAGAAAALVESPDETIALPQIVVADTRRVAGGVAARRFGQPCDEMRVYAITGTNGKTTTAHFVWQLARSRGQRAAYLGTLGGLIDDGTAVQEVRTSLTTPEAPDVQRFLARARDAGCTTVALEASSVALHRWRLEGCRFDAVGYTNLSRGEHLDYHGTWEAYRDAKLLLTAYMKDQAGPVVFADGAEDLLAGYQGPPVTTIGEVSASDAAVAEALSLHIHEMRADATRLTVRAKAGEQTLELPLCARYNLLNALMAGKLMGCDDLSELAALTMPPGRMERVSLPGQPTVIVDYAHTDDALRRLLGTLRPLTAGRLLTVFGCGGDRDPAKRPMMGATATAFSDLVMVTADNPRSEAPAAIAEEILGGIPREQHERVTIEHDREQAIFSAVKAARPGDTVAIAGKGHETEQVIGDQVTSFDDREVARRALQRYHSV